MPLMLTVGKRVVIDSFATMDTVFATIAKPRFFTPMPRPPFQSVAFLVRRDTVYGRGIICGAGRLARGFSWAVHTLTPTIQTLEALHAAPPHGMISQLTRREIEAAGLSCPDIPVVDVSQHPAGSVPAVLPDNRRVGEMAAEHLLQRGLRRFGFLASHQILLRSERHQGFEQTVRDAGFACHWHLSRAYGGTNWARQAAEDRRVARWITSIEAPLGIFAGTDETAAHLLRACREADIAVPRQVAVVGVHNDPMIVAMTRPLLSSVRMDPERIGYESAQLLKRAMEGRKVSPRPLLIPPLGVEVRESSDHYAVDDKLVADALRHIRDEPEWDVNQLADALGVSRRTLERRFLARLGRSPAEEIGKTRIERARRLLSDTGLSVNDVAERSGFASATRLCEAFRRKLNISPARYRLQYPSLL